MDDIASVLRPAASQTTEPSTPQVFAGRYRVTGELGHGGMADVYAAIDEVLCRRVAVKVFRPGPDSAADRERFHAEVRTMAGLTHPNLVSLYDGGQDVTSPWCIMQLLDGGTLADLTDPLPADRVAELGAQLADGLAYIHQQGIVHRDLKPSNVLLDGEGGAYLSDFGVAQLIDASRLTAPAAMVGTAAFLAPEQVLGAPVGPPVDVYALGLVLLEALTRRREYPGGPVEAALARLARPPQIPASLGPRLVELLGAMTSTDPAERPSAAAVAVELQAVADERSATDQLPTLTAVARPAEPATGQDAVTLSARWPTRRTVPAGLRRGALALLAAASVTVALSVALHTPGGAGGGNVSGPVVVTPTGTPPDPVVAAEPGAFARPVELPNASTAAGTGPTVAGVVKPVGPGPARLRPAANPRPATAAGSTGSPRLVPSPVLSPVPSLVASPTGKPSPNPSPTPSIQSTPNPTGSPSSVGPSPKPSTSTTSTSPATPKPVSPTPGSGPSPTSV